MATPPNPKKVLRTATKDELQLETEVPNGAVSDDAELEKWRKRLKFPEETMSSGRSKLQTDDVDVLLAENDELKSILGKCLMELRHKNQSLLELRENLRRLISLSRTQQTAFSSMSRQKDELSVAHQLAVETQLKQLNELQPMTEETRALKQRLISMNDQQQQPSTSAEHQHGIKCICLFFVLILSYCICVVLL